MGTTPLAIDAEIIAHDKELQRRLDEKMITWPVQFEIYRGISMGAWSADDIMERIDKFVGSAEEIGPKVGTIVLDRQTADRMDPSIFFACSVEYEREQAAILEGHGRGLGLMGTFEGVEKWYGGRIQQIVRREKKGSAMKYVLQAPEMTRSHRIGRFVGSRRVLELRIPKSERFDFDVKSLVRKFILAGRVFVPFDSKDGKVYMVETNENYERSESSAQGDDKRMSFRKLITWHNSLSRNFMQPVTKWVARFDLCLSTSIPVCEFKPEHISYIPDEWVQGHKSGSPAEMCLTDGCGYISYSALVAIRQQVGLVEVPTAVQGRVAGGKGLFVRKPNDEDASGPLKIWLRESQHKIKLGDLAACNRAHRIFDLVAPARVTQPSRLSTQLLLNYSANGVSNKVILDLFREGVKQDIDPLLRFSGENWTGLLYHAVFRAGNVAGMRLQRTAGARGRALGVSGRFEAEREDGLTPNMAEDDGEYQLDKTENDGTEEALQRIASSPINTHNASLPWSPFEKALRMLEAGFSPAEEPYLFDLMRTIVKMTLNNLLDKYHVVVPRSAEMFIIPDPTGTLKPRQIHVRFSTPISDPTTGASTSTILGPVLVSRNPTRIASDVEAVEIPDCPELAKYTNVIVMSVDPSSPRSLASYLGGGDYDGDTAMVLWEPEIVNAFRNHDFIPMPLGARSRFEHDVERVPQFYSRLAYLSDHAQQTELIKALLGGLGDRKVGIYSELHELQAYYHGYNDPDAVTLAYLFCLCLDSGKSGDRLIPSQFEKDQKTFRVQKPACMLPRDSKDWDGADKTGGYLVRPGTVHGHILDAIRDFGYRIDAEFNMRLDDLQKSVKGEYKVLTAPYFSARKMATSIEAKKSLLSYPQELELVTEHVRVLYNQYTSIVKAYQKEKLQQETSSNLNTRTKGDRAPARNIDREVRKIVRAYASQPVGTPVVPDLKPILPATDPLLRASYAYFLAAEMTSGGRPARFAFEVAFEDLCEIKAKADKERLRAIVPRVADILAPQRSILQLLDARAQLDL
ncbi:RNA dependent RNA polymerase-domain-containing protein [Vararia minispora EC-137]|uniref:RNA dependent RNA polymerase-domain-containing protein n=1 Tax=Vararia minispora EC-137 TaxID=1314806 RepID=A0ACB8QQA6_9AGAM|nr:RNA dependent RNA polymerase-domain-containing protein [Vararia minispora EC-137]